ncbi:SRPBCC domain-containing protein [Pseudokordiimonas caeni]|uniref:SRPBCC domain-containing protein n=1 Tax=Pseudokordiimonas caeni TaxID=2997908 RepID=UPI002811D154|nr:SRPBCC domain-containing protein [Pseudokordiimonas caeni]
MKPDLQFDFLVDRAKNTVTVKREFAAGRQLVWDCHTKSELLDRWFAPKPLTTKTKSMEFREGGHWHFAMIDPEGNEYWSLMEYRTINPIDGYSAYDGFSDETGAPNMDMPRSTWDVTFTEVASDRTMVSTLVVYGSLAELETVLQMGMQEGLTSTLERLDELLATFG